MKFGKMFPLLMRYEIVGEEIQGDVFSNVVRLERTYKVPRGYSKNRVVEDFGYYDNMAFEEDGCSIYAHSGGWGDSKCKTFRFFICVVPNNGKIIYSE